MVKNNAFRKNTPHKASRLAWVRIVQNKIYTNIFQALQVELGWEEEIRLNQLEDFVDKYPMYKVTVLIANINCVLQVVKGNDFDVTRAKDFSLYLIYEPSQKHFGGTKTPQQFFRNMLSQGDIRWCYACDEKYRFGAGHECKDGQDVEKKEKGDDGKPCENCNFFGEHDCPIVTCQFCAETYKKGRDNYNHRCILMMKPRHPSRTLLLAGEEGAHKAAYAGLVWDIESAFELVETIHNHPEEFELGEDGKFTGEVVTMSRNVSKHIPIAVSFMDVITGHKEVFVGEQCLQDFLAAVMTYNGGKCILFAHNSSGYDSRMIFDTLSKITAVDAVPILRGAKFIQLKTHGSKVIFRDSMLHMPGSLRNLGKSFGLAEEKGFFPYLFCTIDNFNAGYVGVIPDKKHFDLPSSCRDAASRISFDEWYSSWEGRADWDLKKELLKYLDQDIVVLAKVIQRYHKEGVELNNLSPLFSATGPSYVHEVIVSELVNELELPDPKNEKEEYAMRVHDLARTDFWGVQKPCEYWFARRALRGGKTDTRCIYYKISEEEKARGVTIAYQDMVSMYPTQQVKYDYPTGTPTIHVWDQQYYPCLTHQTSVKAKCSCPRKLGDRFCKIVDHTGDGQVPTAAQIRNDPTKYFGIWCISWQCPKDLFHPVLVSYNADTLKCVASLKDEDYVEHCSTSPEVIRALELGYKIKKIHRFDAYKKSPPLWADIVWRFYIRKMIYSRTQPSPEEFEKLIRDYEQEYGQVVGDMIRETAGKWENNKAKKTICKRDVNCGWGKQCQQPNQGQNLVADHRMDAQKVSNLFQNLTAGNYKWGGSTMLGEDKYMYRFSFDSKALPNLHNFYLPAGLFVPAYGRLELLTQLHLLGKRVLYHDTDSIIYKRDPLLYNIPQSGILGGWELEDIDKLHGGIEEFVGMAPKTYALKAMDGATVVKAKGISLSNATTSLVNFESMKAQVLEFMESGTTQPTQVPTTNFNYNFGGKGVTTHRSFKTLKFNPFELKGELRGAVIYPFGYDHE